MKSGFVLLFVLCLIATLFTGCGEETATTVTTTTVAAGTDTTVSNDTATTTTSAATTTKLPTTDHVNGTSGSSASSATTTAKPTVGVNIVDPKGYKDAHYYVGALQPDGSGLVRPRVLFDGEYAVIMHYMYSATKDGDDPQPFEYGGKTYYGQGEGMSPYAFELTATEILIKDQNNNGAVIMKLALLSDGNMKVTATTDNYFPLGLILTPTAQ